MAGPISYGTCKKISKHEPGDHSQCEGVDIPYIPNMFKGTINSEKEGILCIPNMLKEIINSEEGGHHQLHKHVQGEYPQ